MPSDRWEGHNVPIRFRYTHDWTWSESPQVITYGSAWFGAVPASWNTTTQKYISIFENDFVAESGATPGVVTFLAPAPFRLTSLAIQLDANAAVSTQFALNVNGVTVTDSTVTLAIGVNKNTSAAFVFTCVAGDTVCLEALAGNGQAIRAFSVAYEVDQSVDVAPSYIRLGAFGVAASPYTSVMFLDDDVFTNAPNTYFFRHLRFQTLAMRRAVAFGVGQGHAVQTGQPLTAATRTSIGNTVSYSAGQDTVSADLDADCPIDGVAFGDGYIFERTQTGSPTGTSFAAFSYRDEEAPFIAGSLQIFGHATLNQAIAGTERYFAINYTTSSGTLAARERIVPTDGRLKRFRIRAFVDLGSTYEVRIRVNGVLQGTIPLAGTGGQNLYSDDVTVVEVVRTDLVTFGVISTVGPGAGIIIQGSMTFESP